MDAAQIALATDKDIENAFRTLPDASGWNHPKHYMRGGNVQLSREFANFAKMNPERAIQLIGLLDPEHGTRATGYALETMAEDTAPEQVLQLLQNVADRRFDGEEFRSSASRAITKLVNCNVDIGEKIVALLTGWLTAPIPGETSYGESKPSIDSDRDSVVYEDESDEENNDLATSLLWDTGHSLVVPGGSFLFLKH